VTRVPRGRVYAISRLLVCAINAAAIGTLLLRPAHPATYVLDVLVRAYLVFLGTVMAHEGVHGHLGATRRANLWWGRLALLPSMVPFTNFRRTHRLHHAHTNEPDRDPDYFLRSRSPLEIPLRAIAMPHHWFFWLRARGLLKPRDLVELVVNYCGIAAVYALIVVAVGPARLLAGMAPALAITSVLLWYPFAIQTHAGYSTGAPESRSHNYYGRFMYWFSLGLSMHRVHHMKPWLSWLEMRSHVESAPDDRSRWVPRRDIRLDVPGA